MAEVEARSQMEGLVLAAIKSGATTVKVAGCFFPFEESSRRARRETKNDGISSK